MLLFSARSGALAARIGPRLQMTAGPLIAAFGMLLMLRIGPDASYLTDVLPAVAGLRPGDDHAGRAADRDRAGRGAGDSTPAPRPG